jgi:tRNA 5-methylaminomethyl-2-thiouridine biosynthesis bifunctional protein
LATAPTPCRATHHLRPSALPNQAPDAIADLTADWAGAAQWQILEIGFNGGANFLRLWQAWRADEHRPKLLHVVCAHSGNSIHADAVVAFTEPGDLARKLQRQLWGLLPGFHRLVFDDGLVTLTLCIGPANKVLKQQQFSADGVLLADRPQSGNSNNSEQWDVHTLKILARLCKRGARLICTNPENDLPANLAKCGFVVDAPITKTILQARFNPAWQTRLPRAQRRPDAMVPSTCVVVGAGLAGSAVAASLARRGWQVSVLDRASAPASGASSLPAGLLVPHISPDDSQLSRLSRSGVRATLQQTETLLTNGEWSASGVLTLGLGDGRQLPPESWSTRHAEQARDWGYGATSAMLAQCSPATAGWWHAKAGWIKPASLVRGFLALPGVAWQADAEVAVVKKIDGTWTLLDAKGTVLAQAQLVVLAAAFETTALAATSGAAGLQLQPIRGQVTVGSAPMQINFPPFPVNGHGGFIPSFQDGANANWLMGASYERDAPTPQIKQQDHAENLVRLRALLPPAAQTLAPQFENGQAQGWAGVRCATPNRLPLLAQLNTTDADNATAQLWACTGMGSRALTFAALCGELLAAYLHHEPLPIERQLADALSRPAHQIL